MTCYVIEVDEGYWATGAAVAATRTREEAWRRLGRERGCVLELAAGWVACRITAMHQSREAAHAAAGPDAIESRATPEAGKDASIGSALGLLFAAGKARFDRALQERPGLRSDRRARGWI